MTLHLLNNQSGGTESSSSAPAAEATPKIKRIEIDRELCIGAESCVIVAPDVYEMDDENIAILKDGYEASDDLLLESAQACPVAAILLFDEHDNQVYP